MSVKNLPPKLSSTSLLLWGAGLLVVGIVVSVVISHSLTGHESVLAAQFWSRSVGVASTVATVADLLGIGFIVATFIVEALKRNID